MAQQPAKLTSHHTQKLLQTSRLGHAAHTYLTTHAMSQVHPEVSGAATLDFKDCSYAVKVKSGGQKTTKTLIRECSASVPAGSVLAIMGPSGAGKTTLLSLLTLDRVGGSPHGHVTLNGNAFTLSLYQKHAAVVQQLDFHWGFLTAREHLLYAASLFQSFQGAPLSTYVDILLTDTGLSDCQHVKAGNMFLKGLSGGQRRRLSLAIALCKKPHVTPPPTLSPRLPPRAYSFP